MLNVLVEVEYYCCLMKTTYLDLTFCNVRNVKATTTVFVFTVEAKEMQHVTQVCSAFDAPVFNETGFSARRDAGGGCHGDEPCRVSGTDT